ncbi:hypothetical protein OSB04_031581 [Centaurea solstitialis]|uniref:CCHC-type domain-containing protein n=1 Tax=Centaurea solstitialis TaxID=347529 RepID=A0AA38SHA5_9ASTR|nr:hypothetical protein OSB04_031581 [Centaurea solstitialis]
MGDSSKVDKSGQIKDIGSTTHFQCPLLNSTNYTIWSIRMRTILQANGLWEMIEPTDQTKKDDKSDKIAMAYLFQALPEDLNLQVATCKGAKEIWDTLKIRNIGVEQVQKARLQTLRSEFEALEMNEGDSLDSFIVKMTNVISKITSLGTTFDQPTLVRKLLNSMPDKYLQIVAAIEQYSDLDKISFDEAIGRLKTFEERLKHKKNRHPDYQGGLMFAQREDQRKAKYVPPHIRNHGNVKQHEKEENPSQDNNKAVKHPGHRNKFTRDFSNIKCYNCNKYGHYASHCGERSQRYRRQEHANLVEEDLEPTLLMATIEEQGVDGMINKFYDQPKYTTYDDKKDSSLEIQELEIQDFKKRVEDLSFKLYSSRYLLQPQHVVPVRFYAKEAASKAPPNEKKFTIGGMKLLSSSSGQVRFFWKKAPETTKQSAVDAYTAIIKTGDLDGMNRPVLLSRGSRITGLASLTPSLRQQLEDNVLTLFLQLPKENVDDIEATINGDDIVVTWRMLGASPKDDRISQVTVLLPFRPEGVTKLVDDTNGVALAIKK